MTAIETDQSQPNDRGSAFASTIDSPGAATEERWFPWLAVVMLAGAILPAWCCEYFPSHNGPSLLSIAHLFKSLDDPQYGYGAYYERRLFPIPYLGQLVVSLPLLGWLAPATIGKVLTTMAISLRFGAVWFWLKQISPARALLSLATLPLAYEYSVMRGYLSFHAGISVGLILFGWHLRHRGRWRPGSLLVLNGLTLGLYFVHGIPLILTGFLMAAYEVGKTGSIREIPKLVARSFLPTIALLIAFAVYNRAHSGWALPEITYSTLREKITNVHSRCATPLSEFVNLGSLVLLALPALLAVGMPTATGAFGAAAKSDGADLGQAVSRSWSPFWLVWGVGVAIYAVAPSNLRGWHKAELHVLPYALITWLAVAPELATRGRILLFCGAAFALVWGGVIPQRATLNEGSEMVAEFISGLDAMPRRVAMLSLVATKEQPARNLSDVYNPTQWADGYYLMDRGGGVGRGLVLNNTLYPVWLHDYQERGELQFPPVTLPDPQPEELDRAAKVYGGVLLWSCPDSVETLLTERGFATTHSRGRLRIMKRTTAESKIPQRNETP